MKNERTKSVSRNVSASIKCGANLLPVKGLIYALSHARAKCVKRGKENSSINVYKLARYIKELTDMARDLQRYQDVNPDILYRKLRGATIAYVNFFYALNDEEREVYLTTCNGITHKKIEREQNLLLIPAIMATKREPKAHVSKFLVNNIYKVPFRVLYHASKAAMHIELLEQAMGIKNAPDHLMKRFSGALSEIDTRMSAIEDGGIDPQMDEALKQRFIDEAVKLSEAADMRIADFISEKVSPNAINERTALRIARK